MSFIRIFRMLLGTVRFEAREGFSDRFVNLCWSMGIPLWNVRREGEVLLADTGLKAYKKARSAAKRAGVRLHVVKKTGLPFLLRRNRLRRGLAAGLVLAGLFTLYAGSAVWSVEVSGNRTVTSSQILAAAREAGLTRAVPRRSVDPVCVRRAIAAKFPAIHWCSVNFRGANVEIVIREKKTGVKVFDESGAYDVVAAKDGQIEMIDTLRGKVQVKNLDTVTAGQLLISGLYEKTDGTGYTVHAAGRCLALTNAVVFADGDNADRSCLSAVKRRVSLYVFGFRIPLAFPLRKTCASSSERDLCGRDFTLPLGVICETGYELAPATGLSGGRQVLLACADAYDRYRDALKNARLVAAEYHRDDGGVRIALRLREDIAEEREIVLPE